MRGQYAARFTHEQQRTRGASSCACFLLAYPVNLNLSRAHARPITSPTARFFNRLLFNRLLFNRLLFNRLLFNR
jgi:hypothetical protein